MKQVFFQRRLVPCARVQQVSNSANVFAIVLQVSLAALVLIGLAKPLVGQNATPVNVTTWRYDNTHAGANTQETLLTPANVTPTSFGKLFSRSVDGYVYAQPLYVSGLTMGDGLVHNVVFVATEHDSIYAFDADSNGGANAQPLWQISLLTPAYGAAAGATTVPSNDVAILDITPEIGITSTGAINLATNTLYVVGKTKENGAYVQRLHAINLITGAEQANSPTVIQASVAGTGNGSSGGVLSFSPLWQNNRTAVSYYNGYVYLAFGSHGDNGPWHGWVLAYNATTLAQTAALCTSATGAGDGIWSAGAGLPIDNDATGGRMFFVTGNGTYSAYPPFNGSVNYGDSIVDLSLANGGLTPTDAFTPFNQATLSSADSDQGSGGILMLPDQQGANPHILLQIGKEGRGIVLNRDALGGYAPGGSSNTNALQDIPKMTTGLWSTPAYWNNNIYMWGNGDYARVFAINSGVISTTDSSSSNPNVQFPGSSFVISSNGTQNGIAWAVRSDAYTSNGPEILYAFDATNLKTILWESDKNDARDDAGPANKFAVPVVTNGKVYVGAAYQVDVYGLLGVDPPAVAPVISPNGGTFTSAQTVALTSTTTGASIYYTLDGSTPTTTSTLYSAPFKVSVDTVVKAIASATNYVQSSVSSATFNFSTQTPPPTLSPAAGTYSTPQQVTLTDTDAAATIYYTLDGSAPSVASTVYTGPITISAASTALNAIAVDPALTTSNLVSGVYIIQSGGSTINYGSGFSSVAGLTLNGSAINSDDSRLQLTDGGTYEAGSVFYNQPINIQAFTTDFSFQLSNAVADGFTFTIQNTGLNALGGNGGDLGYAPIANSAAIKFDFYNNAGEGSDSTGVYTKGAVPELPSVDMTSSGLNLASGDGIQAHVTYDGTTLTMKLTDVVVNKTFTLTQIINIPSVVGSNTAYVGFTGASGGYSASQKILSWTYSTQTPGATTAAPVFSPAGGSFTTPQSVSLSSTTTGAAIYYTTNGTTPTTSSTKYAAAIPITYGTTIVNAIAVAGTVSSTVSSATYVITQGTAPAPVFTPAAGTYAGQQSVTIADTDASAAIYYTLDGSQPTAASKLYSGPITVATSTTVNAIAIDPALQNSSVSSAAYIITANTAINFATGFPSTAGLTVNGNAAVASNLLVLSNGFNQLSSVFYNTPVNVQSFTTNFKFQLRNPVADGFTFTIQNAGLTALGQFGGSLGYGSPTATGGIGQSVAVKFDFYSNSGEGTDSTGLYTNGAYPTTPAIDMTSSGVLLTSGDIMQAQLSYNGTTLVLTLTDTVTSKVFTQSFPVNIPQVVGGNTAYVGFTAGTGGLDATQNIQTWTYTPGASTTPVTATPMFTPAAGSYNAAQSVTIADATAGAVIYYTTNGTTPTTASAVYAGAIAVPAGTTTVEAIAVAPNYSQSALATAVYKVTLPVTAAPTFTPAAGSYTTAQSVTIADATTGAVIYYTTNGTTPTTASATYSGAIPVGAGTTTIEALALAPNDSQSTVTTAVYKVTAVTATPTFTPAAGSYTTAQSVTITDATTGAVIYYTTNGTPPTTASAVYNGAIAVGVGTTTIEALALAANDSQSVVATAVYKVSPVTAAPTFKPAAGTYTSAQSVTIADTTAGAVIYYTTNGATPTTASAVYTGGIAVGAGTTTIKALALATNYSQSAVSTAAYTVTLPATPAPTFSPAGGTYTSAQSVTLTDSVTGAIIYYTTNGTMPTTSSAVYSTPIQVAATETLEAVAVAPGGQLSAVASAAYTIQTTAPTISFPSGFSSAAGLSLNGITVVKSGALQLVSSTQNYTQGSGWYSTPVNVSAFTTDFNFQLLNALADGFTFTIQNQGITAIGPGGSGLGYGALYPGGPVGIAKSLAVKFDIYSNNGEGTDSTGFYTNGASPTTPAIDMTASGVTLASGDVMHAHITYDGTTLTLLLTDTITTKSFTTSYVVNIPTVIGSSTAYVGFTSGAGGYSMTANVVNWTFTSTQAAVKKAASAPLVASPFREAALMLPSYRARRSVNAALVKDYDDAPVREFADAMLRPVADKPGRTVGEPHFRPAPGKLAGSANVEIQSQTPNAVIHYTMDGAQPTNNSPIYHAPIAVSGTALTIKAFASAAGMKDSPVVTGIYRIGD